VVEDVKGLAEEFGAVAVTEFELFGKAKVHVDGAFQLEGVAADDVDTLRPLKPLMLPPRAL